MKNRRFIDIHIEQPGNAKEAFNPSEYVEEVLKRGEKCCGLVFKDGTSLFVSSSWSEAPYLRILLRCCHQVLRIYAKACQQVIDGFYWKVVSSKTGRQP